MKGKMISEGIGHKMKAKVKKWFFKLPVLAMVFLLTGCGGQGGDCGMMEPGAETKENDTSVGNFPAEYAEGESVERLMPMGKSKRT